MYNIDLLSLAISLQPIVYLQHPFEHYSKIKSIVGLMLIIPCITVNGERFAGLNIRGFRPMKFFMGIFSWCLGQRRLLFNYIAKCSWENFRDTLKNCENCESLAQQIFPHLQYSIQNFLQFLCIMLQIPCSILKIIPKISFLLNYLTFH